MFDKNLYVETFSALHASKDTLAEIQKITSQSPGKRKLRIRTAFVSVLVSVLLIASAVLAAGNRMMGGWIHYGSLKDVEDMGFHYPQQLGEYRLSSDIPSRIHIAPDKSSGLLAWLDPDYTWMSLDYEKDAVQSLSVSLGKTDDPLWMYCFNYNETTGVWIGAEAPEECALTSTDSYSYIENVTEYVYKGCTIYLADRITEYFPDNDVFSEDSDRKNTSIKEPNRNSVPSVQNTEVEAHWVDAKSGLCFSISSCTAWTQAGKNDFIPGRQKISQKEMLNYVKSVIDDCR